MKKVITSVSLTTLIMILNAQEARHNLSNPYSQLTTLCLNVGYGSMNGIAINSVLKVNNWSAIEPECQFISISAAKFYGGRLGGSVAFELLNAGNRDLYHNVEYYEVSVGCMASYSLLPTIEGNSRFGIKSFVGYNFGIGMLELRTLGATSSGQLFAANKVSGFYYSRWLHQIVGGMEVSIKTNNKRRFSLIGLRGNYNYLLTNGRMRYIDLAGCRKGIVQVSVFYAIVFQKYGG